VLTGALGEVVGETTGEVEDLLLSRCQATEQERILLLPNL
jgi:hypothetical protein